MYIYIFVCTKIEDEDGFRTEFANFQHFLWYDISLDNVQLMCGGCSTSISYCRQSYYLGNQYLISIKGSHF